MDFRELTPGLAIQLDDITQLAEFEDLLAHQIDPAMTDSQQQVWAGRVMLKDLIRPPKFNGTISAINLVVMADSYERLFDARARGWSFMHSKDSGAPRHRIIDETITSGFLGFTFLADAASSGRGVIGQVRAELWYGPVPRDNSLNHYTTIAGEHRTYPKRSKSTAVHGGRSVQRYVTKPEREAGRFEELDATSRRIGLRVLTSALKHPHIQPMQR